MRALVVSGGGELGALQVGALEVLFEHDGDRSGYDVIYGTSVGSVNGAYIAQYKRQEQRKSIDRLKQLWLTDIKGPESIYTEDPFLGMLQRGGQASLGPLEKIIQRNFDAARVKAAGVRFYVGSTNLVTGKYRTTSSDEPNFPSWILASCAFPVRLQPVWIDSVPYVDGGVRNVVPLRPLLSLHPEITEVDVISCPPSSGDTLPSSAVSFKNGINVAFRCVEIAVAEVAHDDLIWKDLAPNLSVRCISPPTALSFDPLAFKPSDIRVLMDYGRTLARQVLAF